MRVDAVRGGGDCGEGEGMSEKISKGQQVKYLRYLNAELADKAKQYIEAAKRETEMLRAENARLKSELEVHHERFLWKEDGE